MRNSGEDLERLVRTIEQYLLPTNFKVEQRKRVYLDNGKQLAEFDIHISGDLGSSSIKWDIECRDRPSDGPAEGEWIEQLIGRRQVHKFDKIIAVSTTGFSAGARELAARTGVVLRTVTDISDIGSDFRIVEFSYNLHHVTPLGPLDCTQQGTEAGHIQLQSPRMKTIREAEYQALGDFVLAHLPPDVEPDQEGGQRFLFRYLGMVDLLDDLRYIRIGNLRMLVELRVTKYQAKALTARTYAEHDRVIAQEGEFELPSPSGPSRWNIKIITRPTGTQDIVVKPSDDSLIPAGSRFTLYGRKDEA